MLLVKRGSKELALDKQAEDILILNLKGISSIADYFVICSGASRKQIQTIAENIRIQLKKEGLRNLRVEGLTEGRWVVIDYGDAIVHVFDEPTRQTYQLERLWGDAKIVN